jgi:hypothetical protein
MKQALHEIRRLRHENSLLSAQVSVVETFRAVLFGRPDGMAHTPDIAWEIENYLSEDREAAATTDAGN